MATRRKAKIRSDARFGEGWFEVSEYLWREPGQKPEKQRLLADANLPRAITEALRQRGIEVRTAQELGIDRMPDEQIVQEAANRGLTVITLDRDFWQEAVGTADLCRRSRRARCAI